MKGYFVDPTTGFFLLLFFFCYRKFCPILADMNENRLPFECYFNPE